MAEYIKREEVYQYLDNEVEWNVNQDRLYALEVISDFPVADVAEVRHGRWERVSTASGIISRVRCSVCAGTQPLTFENMPYCPTCGARMDEEDGHEIS